MESTDHQLGEKADALFDLAHHFINGENEEKILEYVYPAGLYAMDRYDYDLAARYLTLIKRILERHLRLKVDSANRALWYQCSKKLGEAMIMTGADETGVALLTSLVSFYDDPRGVSLSARQEDRDSAARVPKPCGRLRLYRFQSGDGQIKTQSSC